MSGWQSVEDSGDAPPSVGGAMPPEEGEELTSDTTPEEFFGYVDPYIPPGDPVLLAWVDRSTGDLPPAARLMWHFMARHGDQASHRASVPITTLMRLCRVGSHNTIRAYLKMGVQIRLAKLVLKSQKGNNVTPDTYQFLDREREYKPLPVAYPGVPQYLANSYQRHRIEELEDEIARLRAEQESGEEEAMCHSGVTHGNDDKEYSELSMATLEGNAYELGLSDHVIARLQDEVLAVLEEYPGMRWRSTQPNHFVLAMRDYLQKPAQYRVKLQAVIAQAEIEASKRPAGESSPTGPPVECAACGNYYRPEAGDGGQCQDCRAKEGKEGKDGT